MKETMHERFVKEFYLHRIPKNTKQMQYIEAFISKELTLAKEEIETIVEKMIIEASAHPMTTADGDSFTSRGYNMGYSAALNELLQAVRNKE